MLVLERLLVGHQGREVALARHEAPCRVDLLLELAKDQRGAPPLDALRHVHVAEDVVADVEDLVAVQVEALLHLPGVTAHVGAAGDELARDRPEQAVLVDHLERRVEPQEEVRLPRLHDDEVEQVTPAHVLGRYRLNAYDIIELV